MSSHAGDEVVSGTQQPRDDPWMMRTYSGHSTAAASNALYRTNLAKGQTGLSIAFDLPTQTGYDPDSEWARGEVGKVGVPIAHLGHMLALAAVVAANWPVIIVIALTAVASAAGTAERPASIALLPRLVGEARLGPANALLHTVQDLGVVTGPAVGALLLAVSPDWVAFVANAATFAVSATLITTMRTRRVPAPVAEYRESIGTQMRHGARTARITPHVVPLMLVVAMAELTYGAQTVQLVLYAEQRLDVGADGYGYLLAAVGLGGLLSTIFNGRLAASTRVSVIVVATGLAFCLTQLVYARVDLIAIALVATVIGGAGFVACGPANERISSTISSRLWRAYSTEPSAKVARYIGSSGSIFT